MCTDVLEIDLCYQAYICIKKIKKKIYIYKIKYKNINKYNKI